MAGRSVRPAVSGSGLRRMSSGNQGRYEPGDDDLKDGVVVDHLWFVKMIEHWCGFFKRFEH